MPMSVPMTPMDVPYSQLMLPANLLQTPSPYVTHASFLGPQPPGAPLPYGQQIPGSAGSASSSGPLSRVHSLPMLVPYASPQQLKQQHNSLEHLNFSRTVALTGLAPSLTLREVLDQIDHGPIESVELKKDTGVDADSEATQTCLLSFVNTLISYHFHLKYAKNLHNLSRLKENMHNSSRLRVSVNMQDGGKQQGRTAGGASANNSNSAESDVIKVKTLNYIMEFNATRAVAVLFRILDLDLVPLMEKAFRLRCAKYGTVEQFVVTEDEDSLELDFLVHFTCIDAAIALHDYYSARVASEDPGSAPAEDDRDDLVQLSCLYVTFQQDRCDRTLLVHARKPSAPHPEVSLECISLVSALPISSDKKVIAQSLPENRSPLNSISRESLRESELRLDFKGLDLGDHKYAAQQHAAATGTRATSEQSIDPVDGKSSLVDPVGIGATGFGSDESGPASPSIEPQEYLPNHSFGSVYSGFPSEPYLPGPQRAYLVGVPPSANASFVSIPLQYSQHTDSLNSCNRTIYLGNLHPKLTVEELANNVRAGGLVESIRHYKARRVCFVTFVDPAIALKFYLSHQLQHQLVIRDCEISVKWGKSHSGPLSPEIANAVSSGASRNVYIGLHANRQNPPGLKVPDEATLRRDFCRFGGMEQINLIPKKNCGFMNFLNIANAITVVECFETRDVNRIKSIMGDDGLFYENYRHFKISYGKDRCANPLKFSYVKSSSASRSRNHSISTAFSRSSNILPERIDPIDEETANVFGISTISGADHKDTVSSGESAMRLDEKSLAVLDIKDGSTLALGLAPEGEITNVKKNDGALVDIAKGVSNQSEIKNTSQNAAETCDENDDSADEFDDDDDISIIINPETTDTSFTDTPKKPRGKTQQSRKVYHSDVALSDLLNGYNLNNDSYVSYDQSFDQSSRRGSVTSQSSFHYPQLPPFQHPRSFSRGPSNHPPIPPFPMAYGAPVPPYSGSHVMSDFLAKAQNDHYLYAAAALGGGMSHDNGKDSRRYGRRYSRK